MNAPTLAAITFKPSGGGVAVVSQLLWDVVSRRSGAQSLVLLRGDRRLPSLPEKVRYAVHLAAKQIAGVTGGIVFAHLGLAKPMRNIPRAFRKPYAIFLHGIEAWRPLTSREHALLAGADLRLANSNYTAARVMEMHPAIGPVVACPLALPVGWSDAAGDSRPDLPDLGPAAVLIVGRMLASERYKGHDELIDAWPRVVAAVPKARLVIAGDGDDVPRLQDKARRTGTRDSILFTGFASGSLLSGLYERTAVFALPSRAEGFGLVYLEAMAHRLPCIGSIHDAAGDVIVDGGTGRLVDQLKPNALADAIVDLLQDDQTRYRMGEAGHRRLHDEFTFEQFAERVDALLDRRPQVVAV